MNKRTGVVNERHRLGFGQPSPVAAGNEGDAQAMEAGVDTDGPKKAVEPAVLIPAKSACHAAAIKKFCKDWSEGRVYWHRKKLPWIVLAALCVSQANGATLKVDVLKRYLAFTEPATSVQSDFKRYPHPLRLSGEFLPDYRDVVIRQFGFDCTRADNLRNRRSFRGTSRFLGVSVTLQGRWRAAIQRRYVATFLTEEEAARAYDAAAIKAYGEFANLNFPNLSGRAL